MNSPFHRAFLLGLAFYFATPAIALNNECALLLASLKLNFLNELDADFPTHPASFATTHPRVYERMRELAQLHEHAHAGIEGNGRTVREVAQSLPTLARQYFSEFSEIIQNHADLAHLIDPALDLLEKTQGIVPPDYAVPAHFLADKEWLAAFLDRYGIEPYHIKRHALLLPTYNHLPEIFTGVMLAMRVSDRNSYRNIRAVDLPTHKLKKSLKFKELDFVYRENGRLILTEIKNPTLPFGAHSDSYSRALEQLREYFQVADALSVPADVQVVFAGAGIEQQAYLKLLEMFPRLRIVGKLSTVRPL